MFERIRLVGFHSPPLRLLVGLEYAELDGGECIRGDDGRAGGVLQADTLGQRGEDVRLEVKLESNRHGPRRLAVWGLEGNIAFRAFAVGVDERGLDDGRDREGDDGARVLGVVERPGLANLDVEDVGEGLELHAVPRRARRVHDLLQGIIGAAVGELGVEGIQRRGRAEVDGDRDGGLVLVVDGFDVAGFIHAVPAVPGVDSESLEGHGEDADAVLRHEWGSEIGRGG